MISAADEIRAGDSRGAERVADGRFNNRELSTIAALASLHFAVSFASRLLDGLLMAVLGPFFVFVAGIGDEAIPNLLLAAAVMLVPRVGTIGLSLAVVWLLNGLLTGTFSVVNIQTIAASILLHELSLWIFGVTRGDLGRGSRPSAITLVRVAAALGLANGGAIYVSYMIFMRQLEQHFAFWYISSAAVIVGVFYGAVGAAIGTAWGYQLRRTAP